MRVFLEPTGLFSHAMVRVARALAHYAPDSVEIVKEPASADLIVSHVIGPGAVPDRPEVVIQYCLRSAGLDYDRWLRRWQDARMVWSYLDLRDEVGDLGGVNFYHAPLGVDPVFAQNGHAEVPRDINVMTSGYVSAPGAEAIEEVALAAGSLGLRVLHLGPAAVEGMRVTPPRWSSVLGIPDSDLAALYRRTEWVSGLRQVEGFELPVLEGLACGARPIVFDRPDMLQWYEDHAAFVPESNGEELVEYLTELLRYHPQPVLEAERAEVLKRFSWEVIAKGFWERLT